VSHLADCTAPRSCKFQRIAAGRWQLIDPWQHAVVSTNHCAFDPSVHRSPMHYANTDDFTNAPHTHTTGNNHKWCELCHMRRCMDVWDMPVEQVNSSVAGQISWKIISMLRQNRFRWYGHVLRKDEGDWVRFLAYRGVSNTKPRSTRLIVLRHPRTSPVDSDYALPVVTNFLCHITNSAHLVVGPSLSLDRRLGIRCQLTSMIQHVVASLSDVHWKHSCSPCTSVSSALEVFLRRCAI